MSKVISLPTPIDAPFGKIGKINWDWKPPRSDVEYIPGTTIGEIRLENDNKKTVIPIKTLPADDSKDATIHPLQGEEITFWIKQWVLEHLDGCDCCLRYLITHEFTHLIPEFQFPLPWELRGFGKETMYTVNHYLVDALVDRWNVINKNYANNDPIKFTHHSYQEKKINLTSTTREELFLHYIYLAKFASHCNIWKNNLYNHTHIFPYKLQDNYHKLLDILSSSYTGPDLSLYELVRDIAELMLCLTKKDIIKNELKRRLLILSDMGAVLFEEKNFKTSMQQLWNKQHINIFQLRKSLFDWSKTLKRISDISSKELRFIDDLLMEHSTIYKFTFTYFVENSLLNNIF